MNPRVVQARAISDTEVAVEFANGDHGVLDVAPYLELPVFRILRAPAEFRRVHAAHGTVAWSDDLDLCPDTVWHEAVRTP